MPVDQMPEPGDVEGHLNRLDLTGGAGDVVQARDVHGGVHFHQTSVPFVVTPRQLPGAPRGFVNRETELAYLASLALREADAAGIVVVTGTAGVGKTSLALRCAHNLADHYPDGHLYANLRGYDPGTPVEPAHVLRAFLRALGVPARAVPTDLESRAALYRSILAGRRVLVLLDNAATVSQVRPLLPGTRGSLVIVTSRNRLSGLMAREGARRLQLDLLNEDDAVALLREVTAGHRTGDADAELAELARLCARLPLALRIAAERAAARPVMRLPDLIADLRDESGLWEALSIDGDEGADAVRTVFAWSYRALPEPAARMFRLLGLLPGGEFGPSAAAALAGVPVARAGRDLDALVGAHLIEHTGAKRYQFHDLLRAYANDQVNHLETDSSRVEARRRALAWYLISADNARKAIAPFDRYALDVDPPTEVTPETFDGYDSALRWYRTEAANLVAAAQTAASTEEHATAWRLAAVLRPIYMYRNDFDDWIVTARIGARSAAHLGDPLGEAEALESLGMALTQSHALDQAEACYRRVINVRQEMGDRFGEAAALNLLGLLELRRRRLDVAASHFRQGEEIFSELGEGRWVSLLRANLADALSQSGETETSAQIIREALAAFRERGDRPSEGNALYLLARVCRQDGRLDEAVTAISQALQIASESDNSMMEAHWLAELARIQLARGEPAEALTTSQRSAVIQRRLGDRSREAVALDLTGQAYQQLARHDEAADFHRRAVTVHRQLGDRWQLANALAHLATTLDQRDDDEARSCRRGAADLLAEFNDPVADMLRRRLTT